MTATISESLYALLPAIARIQDAKSGEPLRALLGVMEEELQRVKADIDRLYANCFIETCDEWVVPYIGDLLGARLLYAVSQRAFTANTLAYRRRKGTLQILSALARDVTRWPARAVEYRQLVASMQNVNSAQLDRIVIPNLRQLDQIANIDTPFERTARTVSVRANGKYHMDQLGLYVWRLSSYPLEQVRAVAAVAAGPGFFYMDPLGCDRSLWSPSQSRPELLATTELPGVPQPLQRLPIYMALEARRQALVDGRTPQDPYFDGPPALRIFKADAQGRPQLIPPEQIMVAELDSFVSPPAARTYVRSADGIPQSLPITVAVDPKLGRLAFCESPPPQNVWVSYHYGGSTELGGGAYDRPVPAVEAGARLISLSSGDPNGVLQKLADPTDAASPWASANGLLIVEIADSDSYTLGDLRVPAHATLELRASVWQRPLISAAPPLAAAPPTIGVVLEEGATLSLSGLCIQGVLSLSGAPASGTTAVQQAALLLDHCTLVPGGSLLTTGAPAFPDAASIHAEGTLAGFGVALAHSITGAIDLSATASGRLTAMDSIIDGTNSPNTTLHAPAASLSRVTVFGSTTVTTLSDTIDTLFTAPVNVPAGSTVGISYCYLPVGSTIPAGVAFRCQPDLALAEVNADLASVRARLRPWFVSRRYGTPGYAQLDGRCADGLRNGASIGGEMGVFQSLQQSLRERNLIDSQAEYLRFGFTLNLFRVN